MFKKVKVVMLPTNEKATIALSSNKLSLKTKAIQEESQHLYFLSDEEIDFKKDYVYHVDAAGDRHIIAPNTWIPNPIFCSKIIATTDKLLQLPEPSQSFIEKYVEEYNNENVITEVMIEYIDEGDEGWLGDHYNGEPFWNEKIVLKINPKDNTITIRKVKDSWNREEVITLLHHFRFCGEDIDKFVEQNL